MIAIDILERRFVIPPLRSLEVTKPRGLDAYNLLIVYSHFNIEELVYLRALSTLLTNEI